MCWCFDLHNRPLKPPYICILAPFPLHRTAVESLASNQRLNTEVTIEDVYITSRNLNPSAALAHYLASTSSALVDPKLAAFA